MEAQTGGDGLTNRVNEKKQQSIRRARVLTLGLLHLVLFYLSYWAGFILRFDYNIPEKDLGILWETLPIVLGIKMLVFYFTGNFHGRIRYVTFFDLIVLLKASLVSFLILTAIDEYFLRHTQIPRSILVIDALLTIMALGALRSSWRFASESLLPLLSSGLNRVGATKALIVHSGMQGEPLVRAMLVDPKVNYRVVGFLDTDRSQIGARIGGTPVLGVPQDAVRIAAAHGAEEVLVFADCLPGKELRSLMEQCREAQLTLRVVPGTDHLLSGDHRLVLRDVDINDLLRRDPVQLDSTAIGKLLENRVVMVTGAGGSIGSEICRQILKFNPQALLLVEQMENNLFLIHRELEGVDSSTILQPCIGDITDRRRMDCLFRQHRPEVVFHAAAHKHVPMMEMNCGEAVKNNIVGTKHLVDLADKYHVQHFVMISTDKAVNPTSVMGVTKHLAERYVHAMSQVSDQTKFVVVRFGNVLASAGSVVPIFQEQIRRGGPVTVTHPEMRRFFMTIPEASQLVLQAAAMGRGGEIFVLDMGEPVKIADLAADLIRLSGLTPDDIEITFTGVRPGEKLYEELYFDEEQTLPTPHPKLRVAYHRPFSLEDVLASFRSLWRLRNRSDRRIREKLQEMVPEFHERPEPKPDKPIPHPQEQS